MKNLTKQQQEKIKEFRSCMVGEHPYIEYPKPIKMGGDFYEDNFYSIKKEITLKLDDFLPMMGLIRKSDCGNFSQYKITSPDLEFPNGTHDFDDDKYKFYRQKYQELYDFLGMWLGDYIILFKKNITISKYGNSTSRDTKVIFWE